MGGEGSYNKLVATLRGVNKGGLSTRRFSRYFCYQNARGPRKEEVEFNDDVCSTGYDVIVLCES
jgi:hypothetical protein